ncbi:MAG TPA: heme biosynthesis HemY N-terminal domain-containing protein [Accumulibacter sp.]|uniref:heme biosynthesis HemY N-terminal domain-containing protein n=2 Tax=Accumulibacter sp. TaxID=2053492 RepID=UPI002BEA0082|nr:heme biosynthesis HemY N-terminal domain-containing protein [Accumulibacter sp.]HMW80280.1 heme biosynthesis HemY N-terminal domain-containing protein [Accumulibacter sp.]
MRRLFRLLALFALAVGIAVAVRFNESYLLLVVPPYRVEVSLALALFVLVLAFLLFYGVVRGIGLALALPARVGGFRRRRQCEKAAESLRESWRLLFEGRYSQAMRLAGEASAAGESPGLAALLAARAAQHLREVGKAQYWLEQVDRDDRRMTPARLMVEAEIHLESRCFTEAAETLQRLQEISGRHIAALRLELRANEGCGNWSEVIRLTRLLEKRAALAPEIGEQIKLRAYRELIRQRSDLGQLLKMLRRLPEAEGSGRLASLFAEALLADGAHDEAQSLIEGRLAVEWESALVRLYGQLSPSDPTACIARAESWLPEHPDDAELLRSLGRLCLQQRLWGKAQSYLEASLALADRREVRLELARLFEQTERAPLALPHYRAAAEQAS